MRSIRVILLIALGMLLLGFLIDFVALVASKVPDVSVSAKPVNAPQAIATGEILITHVDRVRRRMWVDVNVEVAATRPGIVINRFALVFDQSLPEARPLIGDEFTKPESGFNIDEDGTKRPYVRREFKSVELAIAGGSEQLYPFDRVRFSFTPRGCINLPKNEVCGNSDPPLASSLKLGLADNVAARYALVEKGDGAYVLRRHRFVLLLTCYFMIVAVVFLYFLFHVEGEVKLGANALGTLAALWGFRDLLVPKNIEAYPTVVDYFVLYAFSAVFAIIIYRFSKRRLTREKR
jgi:hypothetical protein